MNRDDTQPQLTHATGAPVQDNQNSLTAGARGPVLLQDIWLIEKLAHFDREVIPERRMHAKGSGAHGRFTVTADISRYTKARIFSRVGTVVPAFVRFSTVAGERGAADAERDIRGFAVKLYTEEGNWDIVGNNTPVFFFRDPLRFPDLNHAVKRDPRTGMRSSQNNWDFWTLLPEALHQVTIVMSDRGIPHSYRTMHGFGSHTFSLINDAGERTWVKFHFRSQQGVKNLSDAQAATLIGDDRESHQRDLFEAIERGDFPRWTLCMQVMSESQARTHRHNPFDLTKVWPHGDFPLHEVGVLELNRNPDNVFAEVEQAAFSPANIVPGIGFSPDRMLQARLFSYGDAQRYRLGTNFNLIPVNQPKCPYRAYHRDGAMRTDGNLGATPAYAPNSLGHWETGQRALEPSLPLEGAADHWDHRIVEDHFEQPGNLFRLMSAAQREVLFANTARSMAGCSDEVRQRHIWNCRQADPAYGEGVERALAGWTDGHLRDRTSTDRLKVMTDDGQFDAYVARPAGAPVGAVVVLHEVFGVNHDMRETCHELARAGFLAVCPDLFWRQERNVDLSVRSEPDWQRGLALYTNYDLDAGVGDVAATVDAARRLAAGGKVAIMGFCLGGLLTFLSAARNSVDAAVAFHGGRTEEFLAEAPQINSPLQMHLAGEDEFMPAAARQRISAALQGNPLVQIHSYPGCHHAFSRHGGMHFDAAAAQLSRERTLEFLRQHVANPATLGATAGAQ